MTKGPKPADIRFRVDPGDVPAEKAARRLHLSLAEFNEVLPKLYARGFPKPDPDTGMFDLDEIDRWRAKRHALAEAPSPPAEPQLSMGERFAIAHRQRAEGRQNRRRKD
ncbi:hypothetical protein [Bradyrhizobium sp. 23]|uniref:hypothetical protein n=1 Tax=Bradyrhizobium sp. 23 TaxID=2782667 RepID=UPI001FFB3E92|nr:hypothetical protein [Bradyrhizobium sp. 23]MCK1317153.1 hypothetical protein [Bradyrhizobium sp. 23]